MLQPSPFSDSVFDGDLRTAPSNTTPLNDDAFLRVSAAIVSCGDGEQGSSRRGRILMLRSPRSGYGKSHLLARALADSASTAHAIPVVFNREAEPTWRELFRQMVEQLAEPKPEDAPGPLSETARHIFAELVSDLIQRGIVPAENPNRAILGLQKNYRTMFDLRSGDDAPIVEWFKQNRAALAEPLALSLRRRTKIDIAACRFWIDLLYAFEADGDEAFDADLFELGEGEAKRHARDLGKLVCRYRPLVFVFDHIDAFYGNPEAGMGVAYQLSELSRIGVAPLSLLAVNDDVWQSSFADSVPGAILDRLTENEILLGGMDESSARSLLDERLRSSGVGADAAERFFDAFDLDGLFRSVEEQGAEMSPRDLLRFAATTWKTGERTLAPEAESEDLPTESLLPEEGTCPPPARETLDRIRDMLNDVNQRRGDSRPATTTPEKPLERPAPWDQPAESAPPALKSFAHERANLYRGDDLIFDPGAIRHALELAGNRSPLLDYGEFTIEDGTTAARWRSPDHEIIFGFEPAEQTNYWRSLIEQAQQSRYGSAKVVAFMPPGNPAYFSDSLNGHAKERLDVLELDRETLASLAAAENVINSADTSDDVFSQIAPEFDSLWRRITRPIGGESIR